MRGLTGLTLVIAGAVTAIYGYYPEAGDRQAALDRFAGSVQTGWFDTAGSGKDTTNTDLPLVVVDAERRAFSPQSPLFQQVPSAGAHQPKPPAAATSAVNTTVATLASQVLPGPAAAQSGQSADVARAATVADVSPGASAVVTPADRNPPPQRSGITSAKAGGENAHRELTRNLQKELKRVGCYEGEINGSWSPASRRAMKAFTDRVNATLPIEEPDYILLTLVQGHSAEACGVGCPADQMLAKDGRCQPRAIVAQAANKSAKRNAPPKVAAVKPEVRSATEPKTAAKTPEKSAEVGRALEMWAKVTPPAGAGASGQRPRERRRMADGDHQCSTGSGYRPSRSALTRSGAFAGPNGDRCSGFGIDGDGRRAWRDRCAGRHVARVRTRAIIRGRRKPGSAPQPGPAPSFRIAAAAHTRRRQRAASSPPRQVV